MWHWWEVRGINSMVLVGLCQHSPRTEGCDISTDQCTQIMGVSTTLLQIQRFQKVLWSSLFHWMSSALPLDTKQCPHTLLPFHQGLLHAQDLFCMAAAFYQLAAQKPQLHFSRESVRRAQLPAMLWRMRQHSLLWRCLSCCSLAPTSI